MNVIIFGASMVGAVLAKFISEEGHNVHVIDPDPTLVQDLQERMDVRALQGDIEDMDILHEVEFTQADLILAMTDTDATNIVISMIAQSLNLKARIVSWIKGAQFNTHLDLFQMKSQLSRITVISPERTAIDMALDLLEVPLAFEVVSFLNSRIRIAGFRMDDKSPLLGKRLQDVDTTGTNRTLVVAVERKGEVLIPTGQFVFEPQDRIYITLIAGRELTPAFEFMGMEQSKLIMQQTKTTIGGGGRMALHVANLLEQDGLKATLLERDPDRCAYLANQLHKSVIIRGEVTDVKLLKGMLDPMTTYIAMTGNQEVNFISAILARRLGARRAITMLDNEAYLEMAPSMGIDAAIHPKLSAVGAIMRYIRPSKVIDASLMLGGKLDALLVEVQAGSQLDGNPVRNAKIPKGVILAAAIKGDKIMLPDGNMILNAGDQVLLVTHRQTKNLIDTLTVPRR